MPHIYPKQKTTKKTTKKTQKGGGPLVIKVGGRGRPFRHPHPRPRPYRRRRPPVVIRSACNIL